MINSFFPFCLYYFRDFILRPKKDATPSDVGSINVKGEWADLEVSRFNLSHNSCFVMGPVTNKVYTHAIKQDKRPDWDKRLGKS